jgi:uncharacterized membrane-anchored protein YhcB (DUF1043 family)
MISLIIGIVIGIVIGWVTKMPFSHAFLKKELNENMIILEKIKEVQKRSKKAIIK